MEFQSRCARRVAECGSAAGVQSPNINWDPSLLLFFDRQKVCDKPAMTLEQHSERRHCISSSNIEHVTTIPFAAVIAPMPMTVPIFPSES